MSNTQMKRHLNQIREQVYAQWLSRPALKRTANDTYLFIDEMWETGLRMSNTQHDHYQHVMDTIRDKIED